MGDASSAGVDVDGRGVDGGAPPFSGPSPSFGSFDGASAGECKAGHYTGTFSGTYSSFLTFVGVPIPVVGDVNLTLQQSTTTAGEFSRYTISNGTISGTADVIVAQYRCDMVGTLDCATKKLVGGGLRNCTYCVGAFTDAGTCLGVAGHFEGQLSADYDASAFSFVNGTWNGSEEVVDGGDAGISDSGYLGPGNYGGTGTWTAQYGP